MPDRVKIDISTSTIIKVILAVLAVWFLFLIREIALLFFIVLIIVAALDPLVNKMSRVMPRFLSVLIVSIIFLGVLVGIGFIIVPPIIDQLTQLAVNLPIIINKLGPVYDWISQSLGNYQEGLLNLSSQLGKITTNIYSTTVGFISGIVAFLTVLVLSFYMLLERENLQNSLSQLFPAEHKEKFFGVLAKITGKMGAWLRGQFLLMLAVGVLDGIALLSLGIPYALVLALWGGLTEVIPYIGPWLGLVPAVVIALAISPLKGLLVLIAYVLIQQIEAQFLVPKVMGRAVGLSPVIIILVLLIGAKLFGILGIVIAVPVAAVISVIIQEWPEIRKLRERA